jgi:hypothetical protein
MSRIVAASRYGHMARVLQPQPIANPDDRGARPATAQLAEAMDVR